METESNQSTHIKISVKEIIERCGIVMGDYTYIGSLFIVGQNSQDDKIEIHLTRKINP